MSMIRESDRSRIPKLAADPQDRGGPGTPLLSVRGLIKHFGRTAGLLSQGRSVVRAVDGIDF